MSKDPLLIVNFGGPRSLEEVPSFLHALLCDKDVIHTRLPQCLHTFLFGRIAKKRAAQVQEDYQMIGGGSPIFYDTEWITAQISTVMQRPALAFHRYIQQTHAEFLEKMAAWEGKDITVFPLFPQCSYTTTGSIARFLQKHVPSSIVKRMHWIKSYPKHPAYIEAMVSCIRAHIQQQGWEEEEVLLFCSAHGLPISYIEEGDPYQKECEETFRALQEHFPKADALLAYQSQFGKGKWLLPSTKTLCENPYAWIGHKKRILFVPVSFTSDHIETLFEIEEQYVHPLRALGLSAMRCSALNRDPLWLKAIIQMIGEIPKVSTSVLVRS